VILKLNARKMDKLDPASIEPRPAVLNKLSKELPCRPAVPPPMTGPEKDLLHKCVRRLADVCVPADVRRSGGCLQTGQSNYAPPVGGKFPPGAIDMNSTGLPMPSVCLFLQKLDPLTDKLAGAMSTRKVKQASSRETAK